MTLQLDQVTSAPPSAPAEAATESPFPFARRLIGLEGMSSGLILAVLVWQGRRIAESFDITVARPRSVVASEFFALRRRLLLALGVNSEVRQEQTHE